MTFVIVTKKKMRRMMTRTVMISTDECHSIRQQRSKTLTAKPKPTAAAKTQRHRAVENPKTETLPHGSEVESGVSSSTSATGPGLSGVREGGR